MAREVLLVILVAVVAALLLNVGGLVNAQMKNVSNTIAPNDSTLAALQTTSGSILKTTGNMTQLAVVIILAAVAIGVLWAYLGPGMFGSGRGM